MKMYSECEVCDWSGVGPLYSTAVWCHRALLSGPIGVEQYSLMSRCVPHLSGVLSGPQ